MGVSNDQLADLIATTLKDLPDGQFETMWDSQHFEFARVYHQSRRMIDGGTSIQRNVVLNETGAARYRRLYDTDQPTVENIQHQIDVPWCQVGTNYSWDKLEIKRNQNSAKGFINLIESRKMERLWGLAELFEDRGWKTPTSATDNLFPYGVPYYLNKRAAAGAGFDGQTITYGDGSTGTNCAGIDAATEAKWRNYAFSYTKVDNELLRSMRKASLLTRFRPPANIRTFGDDNPGPDKAIYCDDDISVEFMEMSDARDDNAMPNDLAGKVLVEHYGASYFNRVPIVYIPQLAEDADDPIYCIDWSKLQPIVQDGYWMVESEPMNDRTQHTTYTVYVDACHQNLCTNRRSVGWVGHKISA